MKTLVLTMLENKQSADTLSSGCGVARAIDDLRPTLRLLHIAPIKRTIPNAPDSRPKSNLRNDTSPIRHRFTGNNTKIYLIRNIDVPYRMVKQIYPRKNTECLYLQRIYRLMMLHKTIINNIEHIPEFLGNRCFGNLKFYRIFLCSHKCI